MRCPPEFLDAAIQAALLGGKIVRRAGRRAHAVSFKGATDLVTATDRASEKAIAGYLAKRFPSHGFLGEEGGRRAGAEFRWIVDPLDGTMNFAHGMPYYDVSVALERDGDVLAGAVYDPVLGEMYSAAKGRGARCNGKRIRVSGRAPLSQTLLATGFSSALLDSSKTGGPLRTEVRRQFRRFNDFCLQARGVRRPGAAALDLAYVARGIFDGFWEGSLKAWDVAAGWVIVEEAGGKATDFRGGKVDLFSGQFVASNGKVHREMLRVIGA
ncbi:MAG: inositol monophosphatase [Planctomycetes bacterium]|nr:inositol monophosphatase [Planctomycetota bacterium]